MQAAKEVHLLLGSRTLSHSLPSSTQQAQAGAAGPLLRTRQAQARQSQCAHKPFTCSLPSSTQQAQAGAAGPLPRTRQAQARQSQCAHKPFTCSLPSSTQQAQAGAAGPLPRTRQAQARQSQCAHKPFTCSLLSSTQQAQAGAAGPLPRTKQAQARQIQRVHPCRPQAQPPHHQRPCQSRALIKPRPLLTFTSNGRLQALVWCVCNAVAGPQDLGSRVTLPGRHTARAGPHRATG